MSAHELLCVILVITNSLSIGVSDPKIVFRKFIQEYSDYFNEVSFMYMYNDYQPEFVLPIQSDYLNFFHRKILTIHYITLK